MRMFGLIGYPLTHSFSEKYFTEKFNKEKITDVAYKLFPMKDISELPSLLKDQPTLLGLNITIPYKESVIPFIDELDETARAVGAVNCIRIINQSSLRDGGEAIFPDKKIASSLKSGTRNDALMLIGYNTDVYGFRESLKPILKSHHEKALILGTGGAAKAVGYVLKQIGVECLFVTRLSSPLIKGGRGDVKNLITYEQLNSYLIASRRLIINTTPAGMYPEIENSPAIPYEYLTEQHLLYDLIYNPEETIFLKKGKERGAAIQNGLTMLKFQAEKAWEIWNS